MIIKYPLLSEKAVDMIEKENKMVFVVQENSTKDEIKDKVEELYEVKVQSVNTHINPKGEKRAYVTLGPDHSAMDLATELGLI